jgi:hypothetical protein
MGKLTDPNQAMSLARAVVSDVSLYNEKYVIRSRQKGKIIRPLREALQEGYELFESRVDVSVPECAACFEQALDEILQISINVASPEPPAQPPEDVAIELEVSSVESLDPALLSVLTDPSTGSREAEQIVAGLAGQTLAGTLTVERGTLTTESRLPPEVQFGRTVVGVMENGLRVAVAFPKSRSDEIQKVREGASMDFQGTIVTWDGLFKHLVLASPA